MYTKIIRLTLEYKRHIDKRPYSLVKAYEMWLGYDTNHLIDWNRRGIGLGDYPTLDEIKPLLGVR